jgi:flagellar hook-associated protein 3 FlgL
MRITTDSFSNSLISQIQQLSAQQAQYQQALATGQSITNPSDNPAAMGRVLNMDSELQSLQQLSSNNTVATQIAQESYTGLNTMNSIATSASELAVEGSAGTTSATSYQAYSQQLNQLVEQGLQTANSQYNNQYLFGGTKTDTAPFTATRDATGNITGVSYTGTAAGASMMTGEGTSVSPYTDGTTNQGMADFLNNLVSLRGALDSQSSTAVQAVQPALQTSEDNILTAVSGVGAVQSGLEAVQSQNQAKFTSLQTLVSKDTSTDIATTTVQLTQSQAAYQAALESGAKIMQTSLLNYLQ